MNTLLKTRLIKIGNSRGIRIPKLLIDRAGLAGELEVEAQDGQLIVRPAQAPRHGWDAEFAAMAAAGDDRLLDGDSLPQTTWDSEEWEW